MTRTFTTLKRVFFIFNYLSFKVVQQLQHLKTVNKVFP